MLRILIYLLLFTNLWAQAPRTDKEIVERDDQGFLQPIRAWSPKNSYIPFSQTLQKKGTEARLDFMYLNSSTRFDVDGNENPFSEGEFYKQYYLSGEFSYGLTDQLEMGVQLRGMSNSSGTLAGDNQLYQISESGFESYRFRLKYGSSLHSRENFRFGIDFSYRGTLYSNPGVNENNSYNFIVLGDEGNEIATNLYFSYVFPGSLSSFNARIGYRNPGADLSQEAPYGGELAIALKKWALIAGLDGVTTFGNSPYTDDLNSQSQLDWSSTALYNSINREWLNVYGGVNILMGSLRLDLRAGSTVMGASTDAQAFFGASLVFREEEKGPTKLEQTTFRDYAVEGNVIKVSPKGGYVVIDRGSEDGVSKGMNFDIYDFDYISGNRLLAAGYAIEVRPKQSIVRLTRKFVKKPIKNGNIVRGGSQL